MLTISPGYALALQCCLGMATGPLPSSGSGWNKHKSKDEIFTHLNDHGISISVAKQLLELDESEWITKVNGLSLITAMNSDIAETNVRLKCR